MASSKNRTEKHTVEELKKIIKYQQDIIKNYQDQLTQKKINEFLPAVLNPFARYYYEHYAQIVTTKTPLTILRGHAQMLKKRIIGIDPTNAFLLSEEFSLFEKNIALLYDTLSCIDNIHNQIPQLRVDLPFHSFLDTLTQLITQAKPYRQFKVSCPDYIQIKTDPVLIYLLIDTLSEALSNQQMQPTTAQIAVFQTTTSVILSCSLADPDTPIGRQDQGGDLTSLLNWVTLQLNGKIEIRQSEGQILVELVLHE